MNTQEKPPPNVRALSIGALVSITTGRLLVQFPIMHEAIEHVAGRGVWTHELASEAMVNMLRERVLAQHPDIAAAGEVLAANNPVDWPSAARCVDALAARFGEARDVVCGTPPDMDNSAIEGRDVLVVRV